MVAPELPDFTAWLGRQRVEEDVLNVAQARALAAALGGDPEGLARGDRLPAGWHWIYFRPLTRRAELGPDGHERRGAFLPPVPLPRRMWAGGRLRFTEDVRLGDQVTRTSTVQSLEAKLGKSGPLLFATVRHEIRTGERVVIDEEQDLVYRMPPTPSDQPGRSRKEPRRPAPSDAEWIEPFTADAVTLFRFSALTFNGHRIHYDHPYTTEVEGYPGLVVHGPLLALLLLDAGIRNWGGAAAAFRYRALSPVFCDEELTLAGRRSAVGATGTGEWAADLWAEHRERGVTMEAQLRLVD